ncbi:OLIGOPEPTIDE TRANSPORTER-RELATED [Salix purpurea]|uniref:OLIGOPEPTIDE TRANSPORTER-RELATED n=3 Tax=Salix purpurea TaxID=77065 RepID=A0A9Q0PF95_SALPP|nr:OLIGOPEPTIDE TRANSPORTER-RELATED [Salix purpurea]
METEEGNGGFEEYFDWRGQKADPKKHGGMRAAGLACVVEVLENMVFLSNATNFVAYFTGTMHYTISEAANMVTNFIGTSFLLTIFGGYIGDSFFTRFRTFVVFCVTELLGIILLTVQAHDTRLQPALQEKPSSSQAAVLFSGLYAIATGVGGIKAALPAHGADQSDHSKQRSISSFFNWFFFSLCIGGLLSSTIMIWIEENRGWNSSFKISAVVLGVALCIFIAGFPIYRFKRPGGSPITRIFKVFVSASRNRKVSSGLELIDDGVGERSRKKFRFLDKALLDDTISGVQVKETRTFLGLLPIFASTIMMNCCLAQLQTFSVEQGSIMDRKLNNFQIPTQSLTVFPLIVMLASIPLFEHAAGSFKNKNHSIFDPLKRIGLGLALASASMAVAAVVEFKRREAAENGNTLSVFWLGWQYLLLGVSDMLTLEGMLEFFYSEAPDSMKSICTALSWCSTSMGYFLSSLLVSTINSITGRLGREWLGGHNLNHNRLDLFYTILCILNFLNMLNYIYWAKKY